MSVMTQIPDAAKTEEKDWTIMIYMAGDNNLSENMAMSLGDIGGTLNSVLPNSQDPKKINLLTFFDGDSLTAPTQYIDFSEVDFKNPEPLRHTGKIEDAVFPKDKNWRQHKPKQVSEEDLAEGNAASAYSIINFVNWCVNTRKRKAANYALIFSAHSFGFHGTSFLRDESAGGFTTLFKFRWALEQIKKEILGDQKISILGFDSCVMSMLEVGYELKDVAETMIASEGSLPNSGWSYAPLLKRFLSKAKTDFRDELEAVSKNKESKALPEFLQSKDINPDVLQTVAPTAETLSDAPESAKNNGSTDTVNKEMDLIVKEPGFIKETAKNFVTDLINHHNNLLIGGRSIDVAAWDLNAVPAVVTNLNLLAAEFNNRLDLSLKIQGKDPKGALEDKDIEIFQELKKIILQSHYDSQTYMNEQCVDLMDFCQRFIIECKFMEKGENKDVYKEFIRLAKQVIASVNDCVLRSGFSGDEYQFSNGISVFFPWSNLTFSLANLRYRYLKFCKGNLSRNIDLDQPATYQGKGKDWYLFLRNYIFRVTMRQLRYETETADDEKSTVTDNGTNRLKSALDDFSKSNPVWSKSNPVWSKSNPVWSKSNPDASRSNPPWSRSNPDASKSNPDASRNNPDASRGEFGNYLFYFSRFKNFQNKWNISGFSDGFKFEQDFDAADEKMPEQ